MSGWGYTHEDQAAIARQHAKQIADARKARKRAVRAAVEAGTTVPFDMRTLIDDGHSPATIRKVWRGVRP